MTLSDIVERLELTVFAGAGTLDRPVTGGYTGDLLSEVMAKSEKGQIWLTIQGHVNSVAVATLKELSAIILVSGRQPTPETIAKANTEGIPILGSPDPAFELSGRLYRLLNG